ncbi:MAG: MFS transporter, partial [Rhodospirillales bacterium]|nr:MFS transporter [Rhodospirillales bacterium]
MANESVSRWSAGRAVGVFMAAYFAANAINAFMPLWFADRGLSAASIGQVLGIAALLRVLAGPGWGTVADRIGRRRPVLTAAGATAATAALLYVPSSGFLPLLLEREAGNVDGVVHHANGDRHKFGEFGLVDMGARCERVAHQAGDVDRSEQTGAIGRQGLLA